MIECHCGNTYGSHGEAPEEECSIVCSGDKNTKCGGSWHNSVYSTGNTKHSEI